MRVSLLLGCIAVALLSYGLYVVLAADQFFAGDGSAFSASKWGTTSAGPFTSPFTSGNVANFATVNGTGTGASLTVSGFTATENFTLTGIGGTLSNQGNGVVPINVSSGKTLDFSTQAFTTSSTAGYNFTGPGVLALGGGTYGGGFTINSGTLVSRGVNAMGGNATPGSLTINGGTIAGTTTRDFSGKYSGITIGGNFQLGALATDIPLSSSTANLTFSNNMALGAATRTITIGANGTYTLGGIISGNAGTGLTINNATGATGILILNGANTFTGGVTINAGTLRAGSATALGPAANATLTFGASSTGKFQLNGNNTTVVALSTNATPGTPVIEALAGTPTLTDNTTGSDTYAGVLQNGSPGTLALTKSGSGTLTLTGANTYSGTTTVSAGTLQLNRTGGATLAAGNAVSISGTGNLRVSSNQSIGNLTMTAGTLTIDPGVTLTITGTYSASGGTINNQGTIKLNGGAVSFPGTGVTVNNGSAGTMSNLEIASSGVVSLTSSMIISGTLTVTTGTFDQGGNLDLTVGLVSVAGGATLTNLGTGDLTLGAGGVSNAGTITFNANGASCGDADDILIRSTSPGTQRIWSGSGTFTMTDVNVQDQRTPVVPPPVAIVVTSGTNAGNNTGWSFSGVCTAGTYVWTGSISTDWNVAANWSPARAAAAAGDVVIFDGNATPSPIVTNVPTQTLAALRLVNNVTPTLNASAVAPPQTLTLNGATGSDFSVPSGTALTVAGANALKISVASGSTGVVGGQIVFQDGAHRLLGNAASAVTFQSGAFFTTASGFSGNAFGSGTVGDGAAGSIVFASGSIYSHNAGSSPFGASGNPSVVTFQSGSYARYFTPTGFDANGRTYANLEIGKGDPGGVAVDASDSGSGDFQFDNLVINNTGSDDSSLQYTGNGGSTIRIRGNITSVAAGVLSGNNTQDVIFTAGSGGIVIDKQGGGSITFGTSFNSRSIQFESSATVASGTTLTLARQLLLGISQPNSLVMTVDGDIAGSASGYVIGTVKKSLVTDGFIFPVGTINGYSPVQLTNITGTGDFSARAVQALIPGLGLPGLARYWTLSGAITSTNLKFTYLDADIGGNEANYRIVKDTNAAGDPFSFPDGGADDVDEANNTATTLTPVSSFSNWSIVEPNAPTAVKLASFRATENNGEVMLQWQTGYETRNLGYNIYREQDGKRVAITPSLVAGSALVAGRQTRLGAGLSYTWYDKPNQNSEFRIQNSGAQSSEPGTQHSGTSYWLEDVDLNGTRTLHGPIVPEVGLAKPSGGQGRADLIGEVSRRTSVSGVQFNAWVTAATAAPASSDQRAGQTEAQPAGSKTQFQQVGSSVNSMRLDPSDMQHDIAGMAGVKIAVSRAGWYRVTQAELAATGFSVPDAKQLQLYRNGREVAISVSTNDSFTASDYLEFYGEGLDSPTDNAQTYYLVNGKGRSARINLSNAPGKAAASGPQSFAYTVERKERMIYFSSLLNGDNENFFGQIVSSEPISATMPVSSVEAGPAQLEVVLQGVTSESHLVQVRLNGADLGTINFANTDHASQTFAVPATALREGDNTVELTSLGGASDVSLVDVMHLTYNRGFVAQDNALAFSVASQQGVRISGFTNPAVRVFDVSDSLFVSELKPLVTTEGGGYTAYVEVRQASALSPHALLAIAGGQAQPADSVRANNPSSWWTQTAVADYVIVTTAELKSALEALAQLRRGQGMTVAVVDVEDIYDEFSFGKHSPEAIRSFLLRANKNWKRQPHFVLLAGDASYDPKNYLGQGMNDLVPTRLVDTALNETASDDWLTDFNGDGIGDLAVGRLPVRTAAEAGALVNKIIGYESASPDPSRGALLVADTHFEAPSKTVQNLMPAGLPVQTVNRGDTDDATAHNLVVSGINQGPRLANYFGHGSNGIWSGAGLLSSDDTAALTNTNRLSVFTMMTCFNGYFQDPYNDSLSEALLKARGGAVAVWASTTLTEPAGQDVIGAEFYRLLFGVQPITLGDAARAAKSVTNDRDVRRTWTLFGDPAMRLR